MWSLTSEPSQLSQERAAEQGGVAAAQVSYRPELQELSTVSKGTQGELRFEPRLGIGWSLDKLQGSSVQSLGRV